MKEVKRRLEDVTDLVHLIQSLLPVEEAARTCVLSKSWRHAWNTIPTLRFHDRVTMHFIDRTMSRYYKYNIPVKTFDLRIRIKNKQSASLANKWIQTAATQRCLKELSLTIYNSRCSEFILTDEIFSGENLHIFEVYCFGTIDRDDIVSVTRNRVINCVSLRILTLYSVKISDKVLNSLFSTCTLLEEIHLLFCTGLTNIKIKNLRYLQKLKLVSSEEEYKTLEVDDVPNLETFGYKCCGNPRTFKIDSISRVTKLSLFDVILDVAFFDNIKSKLHFLENLKLEFSSWCPEKLDITSASLKKLTIIFFEYERIDDVQVSAPKLCHLIYGCPTIIPNLSFQNHTTPGKIQLDLLDLGTPTDNHRLYNMRELLDFSSEFDIGIKFHTYYDQNALDMDIDDLKIRFPFPAKNVHKLSFSSDGWLHPSYLDALFTICHPNYITAAVRKKYSSLTSELLKRKTLELKHIEFKNSDNNKWEHLTDTSLVKIDRCYTLELKLNWCSL
ncbi:F-box protein At5g03100-like [Rutidosis leptorrhynchoides]|uniref:F-box protein At5g03100-like n=1 Tax=Rutidosis leptorrhynchoides TaxID=125765 RepID=UPI003A9A211C